MLAFGSQRALFDIPSGVAYFNTAYNAPLLNSSRERLADAAGAKSRPWERTADNFFADAERVRELAADLFGGEADGYAVIPAASYGVSAAARAIEPQLRPGDRILAPAEEFPSNVLPWRRAAGQTGAVVTTIPKPADGDWTAPMLAALAQGARVAAVANCHWTDGARLDLVAIGQACREAGALLVLDITQSLGAMPIDLEAVRPDFMVCAGYKWLLCPYGFGLMYVAPAWRDARPLEETWLARTGAENFAGLVNYSDEYRPGARRFDVGETCVTTVLPGAVAALEQLRAWGVAEVAASLAAINARLQARLEGLGFQLPLESLRCPHMFGARLPARYSGDLVGALRARDVFVSQRGSSIRFAPHLHVTEADIDQLFAALDGALG
ncbi:MAG TPA: aminotransferase class V-fold PLP-dependent enzyme [Phenylobacterium sp.]|nr:aminotransferase class V-fold PLP-dependent enzyme [Phenylobacterium sp.]